MPASLYGKGLWAYAHGDLENFRERIRHAIWLAPKMGATHILFKVGDGARYYADRAREARQLIRKAGLAPFAWMYLRLSDPEGEAQVVVQAFDDGYEAFVFDVEGECRDRYEQATQLGNHLARLGVDPDRLYLCSFPNIYMHRDLPYDQMAVFCRGGTMPMSYGTFLQPPETVIDTWTYGDHERWCEERGDSLPVYPALGPYYDEHGQQQMTPEELALWLERLQERRPTFFSVYTARAMNPAVAPLLRAFALGGGGVRRLVRRLRDFLSGPGGEEEREPATPTEDQGENVVVESPDLGFLRLRAGPTTASDEIMRIPHGAVLLSLEGDATAEKVGRRGQWLHVRTPDDREGYVAAWYIRWPAGPDDVQPSGVDDRQPVEDSPLPLGQSAWLYGMHAASINDDDIRRQEGGRIYTYREEIRNLFHETGRRGWVLFTEAIGYTPDQPNEKRKDDFWNWGGQARYGLIVRLNNNYKPNGTLPESTHYEAFADTCAAYAKLYLKHPEVSPDDYKWVIIIGNEPNNPGEWPGGPDNPREIITPELYAKAFNLAYGKIKSEGVLPNAIVVPGAVDPHNYDPRLGWKPLNYFTKMLEEIEELDGFALHTYTHGHNVDFITHLKKFDHDPLTDHYYDFQAYRPFMERVPAKWRHLPVYITETNPLFKTTEDDKGWRDENIGWVQKAYEEVNRWNSTPHAQQIRALLLYRWVGDEWTMRKKEALVPDLRAALARDYRWRDRTQR